jgi:K+-transporting ATPase ATPase C chain
MSNADASIAELIVEIEQAGEAYARFVQGLSEEQVRRLVDESTDGRGLGFLGDPGVNVLKLNIAVQAARR